MRTSAHDYALHLMLVGVLATGLAMTGCGLKGPLYRPGEKQKKESSSTAPSGSSKAPMSDRVPAPQSQKTDGTTPSTAAPTVDPDRPATPPGTP